MAWRLTRGVDVEVHGLVAVLVLQVEHLSDDELRDRGHQLQQRRVEQGKGVSRGLCI
jgi:hypothetical protein